LLVLAAIWFALYAFGLTAPPEPSFDPSLPRSEYLQAFFTYKQIAGWQEIGFTLVAAVAFLLIAPIGAVLREVLGRDTPEAAVAGTLFIVAACLLVAGQMVQVGTQWAVLNESKHDFSDITALAAVWDTGLIISNWLENGGYFSLAFAVIGWATVGLHIKPLPRGWVMLSLLLSAALLIVVISQGLEIWSVYDLVLPLSGAILAPLWFLLTARLCGSIEAKFEN
jgi:hypothetical protein